MSDISIPGVSSRFNTNQMVEELVKAERVPLDRMEQRKTDLETERSTWQAFNRQLVNLRDKSRSLFGFENPFNDRSVTSSNEAVLTATSDRSTPEGTSSIIVHKVAKADKFISNDIPRDFQIPQGIYDFTIGSNTITLRFRGGSLSDFSTALNRRNPELLSSSVINNRSDSQVLTIESRLEGAENALGFSGDALSLAKDLGIISSSPSQAFTPELAGFASGDLIKLEEHTLRLAPGSELRIPIPTERLTEQMVLRYQTNLFAIEEGKWSAPPKPQGPQLSAENKAVFNGITLPDFLSSAPLPELPEPTPPPRVESQELISAKINGQELSLPEVPIQKTQDFSLPLSELGIPSELVIKNTNTHRNLEISNIEIKDPNARGEYRPTNPVSLASDTEIEIEGVRIVRSSNTISDVIPGITLNVKRESSEPVSVTVEPDRDRIKDVLIEFVATYNQVVRDINILSRNQPEIVEEITYFTPEEREDALEKLGSLQGNSTLNTIKNRLQTITMSPQETSAGQELRILAQIGIATNASGQGGTGISASRLRGYLEINESQLDQALVSHFSAVKELFGKDSDGDLIVDSGVAYQIDEFMRPFVQSGGILSSSTQSIDRQIERTESEISSYEDYLIGYEQRMKEQFGRMESAINSLETQSRDIQGLNPNNQNR